MTCWRVTPERGFLMAGTPLADAAAEAAGERAAAGLPRLLAEGRVREAVRDLPAPDVAAAGLSDRAAERLRQACGFLANACLWSAEGPPLRALPPARAIHTSRSPTGASGRRPSATPTRRF